MKRFGFSLNEDLHAALQARAEEEGTSMAAICREALLLHLQRPALELPLCVRPDTQGPLWKGLKRQVQDYLEESDFGEAFAELDSFLGEPYRPEHTPDLFIQEEQPFESPAYEHRVVPKMTVERIERPSYPRRTYHQGGYDTRYLDELWA